MNTFPNDYENISLLTAKFGHVDDRAHYIPEVLYLVFRGTRGLEPCPRPLQPERNIMRRPLPLLVLMLLNSCRSDIPPSVLQDADSSAPHYVNSTSVQIDSMGVEVVSNPGVDTGLDWAFGRLWSLGGAADHRLSVAHLLPNKIATDDRGRIYVLDSTNKEVLVISSDGVVVDAWGGAGSGPGELRIPMALAVDTDGTVAVSDFATRELVMWALTGDPLGTVRLSYAPIGRIGLENERILYTARRRRDPVSAEDQLVSASDTEKVLVRMERLPSRLADFPTCGARGITVSPLFAPELHWAADGAFVVANSSALYELDVLEGGTLIRRFGRTRSPQQATQKMAAREAESGWPLNDCMVPADEVVQGAGFAELIPAIAGVVLAPSGEIWVLRGGIADDPNLIDIFSRTGVYLGTLPPGSPFPAAFLSTDKIVTIEKDAMDVPIISVQVVRRSGT